MLAVLALEEDLAGGRAADLKDVLAYDHVDRVDPAGVQEGVVEGLKKHFFYGIVLEWGRVRREGGGQERIHLNDGIHAGLLRCKAHAGGRSIGVGASLEPATIQVEGWKGRLPRAILVGVFSGLALERQDARSGRHVPRSGPWRECPFCCHDDSSSRFDSVVIRRVILLRWFGGGRGIRRSGRDSNRSAGRELERSHISFVFVCSSRRFVICDL